jgi:methylated-DNA-protein-cysteine methyltransferase related protein
MPKSAAFIRIKAQVLEVVASIAKGQLCTFQSIGEHLDVMPRHVAYILAQLDNSSKMVHPWFRVVSGNGSLGVVKKGPDGSTQAELLRAEGIVAAKNSVAAYLPTHFLAASRLPHGIKKQRRPAPSVASQVVKKAVTRLGSGGA